MALNLKPTPESKEVGVVPKIISATTPQTTSLFDGVNTAVSFPVNTAIEMQVIQFTRLHRLSTATGEPEIKILQKQGNTDFIDVTNTFYLKSEVTKTGWRPFTKPLPPGVYKFLYEKARTETEWFAERIDLKVLAHDVNTSVTMTFNDKHFWERIGTEINSDLIKTRGAYYYDLLKPTSDLYLSYLKLPSNEEGVNVFQSEEVNKAWGIATLDSDFADEANPRLVVGLSQPFIPIDKKGDAKLYFSTPDDLLPYIETVDFSAKETHNTSIELKIKVVYDSFKKIKFRFKLNDGVYGEWSNETMSTESLVGNIASTSLKIGDNDITIQVADALDVTKVTTYTYAKAIKLNNEAPQIAIITLDSDSFMLHFTVTDVDLGDLAKYRLTLSNSSVTNLELVPWTDFQPTPLDIRYYIDTTNVVFGANNIIKIEVKDNFGMLAETVYTFEGDYKNLLFTDEQGEYLTTDKGVLLKLLNLGVMVSGRSSEPKKVTLVNKSSKDVDDIRLSITSLNQSNTMHFELSKSNNPFIPEDNLIYGGTVLRHSETLDFYVRATATRDALGVFKYEVNVQALPEQDYTEAKFFGYK